MAGRGPIPKPPDKRARRNKDPIPATVLRFEPCTQPRLPPRMPSGEPWPSRTRAWWRMWAASPLSSVFTSTDWSELLDTAVLHGEFWLGRVGMAAELRQRVAKFGATPEDRARLRITFAAADDADAKRPVMESGARERRGTLHALPPAVSAD